MRDAIHEYFRQRAQATRRALRQLFRVGRISLVIGVGVLAAAIGIGEAIAGLVRKESYGGLIKETLVIGGWEDRLAAMDVRVVGANAAEQPA